MGIAGYFCLEFASTSIKLCNQAEADVRPVHLENYFCWCYEICFKNGTCICIMIFGSYIWWWSTLVPWNQSLVLTMMRSPWKIGTWTIHFCHHYICTISITIIYSHSISSTCTNLNRLWLARWGGKRKQIQIQNTNTNKKYE